MMKLCSKLKIRLSSLSLFLYIPSIIFMTTACQSNSGNQEKAAGNNQVASGKTGEILSPDYGVLVGRWLRPDGGYVIEIQKVDMNGKVEAAYYNPRTINVSQALAARKDGQIHLFFELRDVGYPGATYTLTYDHQNDVLNGLYYQPAAGQTFEVQFLRKE
jgi:hypothetical protein